MDNYNIVSAVFDKAVSQPDTLAIAVPKRPGKPIPPDGIIPYREISFKDFAFEIDSLARGLMANGFQKGDRVVMLVPPSFDFFTISFALMQCGIIPVLIDPGIGIKNLKKCIGDVDPVGFIGISKAHVARILLGWGRGQIKKKVTIGPRLFWGGHSFEKIKQQGKNLANKENAPMESFRATKDDLAAILFTSGSTGISKGVSYTFGNFKLQIESIQRTFGMESGEIDLPTFPPFALFNPTVGMSTIIPDMDPTKPALVDPEKIITILKQFKVTNMFGSPALINRVGRYVEANNVNVPTLRRVISAGAPVPAKVLRSFSHMLNDGVQIFTPYGATEAMPITCVGSYFLLDEGIQKRSSEGAGICVGKSVDGITLKIIKITDEPIEHWSDDLELPDGEVGEITVQGLNVTRSYYNRDEATKLAKIIHEDTFYHRMGDLGYKDEDGNIWFCGRKAHRVRLVDKELYSVQWETIFNQHPAVYRTALVEVNRQAVLCIEIDKEAQKVDSENIKVELAEYARKYEIDIKAFLFHPSFPVDIRHNAKIFREKLAVWASSKIRLD